MWESEIEGLMLKKLSLGAGSKIRVGRIKMAYSNNVYRISSNSNEYVLKVIVDPKMNENKIADKEKVLLHRFDSVSPRLVSAGRIDGHPYILMEKLKGKVLTQSKIDKKDLVNLAKLLSEIHSTKVNSRIKLLLNRKYLKVPEENLEGTLKWLRKFGVKDPLKSEIIGAYKKLRGYYSKRISRFDPVICHGDFKLGNIIRTDKGLITFDWETALIGDPAYDIAVFLFTSDSEKKLSENQKEIFIKNYQNNRYDPTLRKRIEIYYNLANLQAMFWSLRDYIGYNNKNELKEVKHYLKKINELDLGQTS